MHKKISTPLIGSQLSGSRITLAENFCMQISKHGTQVVFTFYNCDDRSKTTYRARSIVFSKADCEVLGLSRRAYAQIQGRIAMSQDDFDRIHKACVFFIVMEKHSRHTQKTHKTLRHLVRTSKAFNYNLQATI